MRVQGLTRFFNSGFENGICGAAAGWAQCSGNPEACNQTQISMMNSYITDFMSYMSGHSTYTKQGNGAFIHSKLHPYFCTSEPHVTGCHTHCEAQGATWNTFEVNGVSMQQAVSKWWNSDGSDPATKHTYTPCQYHAGPTGPRKCNPTC